MLLSLIRIILFLFEKHPSFDHAPFFGEKNIIISCIHSFSFLAVDKLEIVFYCYLNKKQKGENKNMIL